MIPIGTRIRFTKTLTEPASGDHPALIFARAGDFGRITGHGTREGYWATWDNWKAPFGVAPDEFEVVLSGDQHS